MRHHKTKVRAPFVQTRKAIGRIKQPSIRRDFAEMLTGVEFYLVNRQKRVACMCAHALLAMAIGLNRTISPPIAAGILDGLLEDGKNDAALRRAVGVVDTHNDMRCIVGTGTGVGKCQPKNNMTCYTIRGVEGCGGRSGFKFPWTRIFA